MSVRDVRPSTWVTLGVFVVAAVLYALTGPDGDGAGDGPDGSTGVTTLAGGGPTATGGAGD